MTNYFGFQDIGHRVTNASRSILLCHAALHVSCSDYEKTLSAACVHGGVSGGNNMDDAKLLERITYNPEIFGGKPIIRGKSVAVEHILGMLAAGHTHDGLIEDFPWMEIADINACLLYAARMVGRERFEPVMAAAGI